MASGHSVAAWQPITNSSFSSLVSWARASPVIVPVERRYLPSYSTTLSISKHAVLCDRLVFLHNPKLMCQLTSFSVSPSEKVDSFIQDCSSQSDLSFLSLPNSSPSLRIEIQEGNMLWAWFMLWFLRQVGNNFNSNWKQ